MSERIVMKGRGSPTTQCTRLGELKSSSVSQTPRGGGRPVEGVGRESDQKASHHDYGNKDHDANRRPARRIHCYLWGTLALRWTDKGSGS